jgi:DNA topoisomerase-2
VAEISALKTILGLVAGKVYTDTRGLRYGHVMIMADQDHDGSHIKGLVINFFHSFWPSLLQIPGFLQQFVTPIVKVTPSRGGGGGGGEPLAFYSVPAYQSWRRGLSSPGVGGQDGNGSGGGGLRGWQVKYYKGLGTSTSREAQEYFRAIDRHRKVFAYAAVAEQGEDEDALLDMAFSKKKAHLRREWLNAFQEGGGAEAAIASSSSSSSSEWRPEGGGEEEGGGGGSTLTYADFVHRELVQFSMADNLRSIPSIVDGLKPSQRKVLFACFRRRLSSEIKVAQLSGYVAEHSGAAAAASFVAAVLTEIYLCSVCSCQEMLSRNGRGKPTTTARPRCRAPSSTWRRPSSVRPEAAAPLRPCWRPARSD